MTPTPQTLALWNAQAAIHAAELEKKYGDDPAIEFKNRPWELAKGGEQELTRRCAEVMERDISTLRSQIDEATQIADRFRSTIETLEKALASPRLQLEQPCGCILCVCDHSESCTGCGAKFCGKPDCVMKVNEQGRLYEDAPSYVQLRSQLDALKGEVAELAKDKARLDWFIHHLNLDERDCGCPPIASVALKLVANASFNDEVHLLRQAIDTAMDSRS